MRRVCGLFNLTDFGCPVYSLVDSQKRNKLEFKYKKCIFIGFFKRVKGLDFGILRQGAPLQQDVVFDEESML